MGASMNYPGNNPYQGAYPPPPPSYYNQPNQYTMPSGPRPPVQVVYVPMYMPGPAPVQYTYPAPPPPYPPFNPQGRFYDPSADTQYSTNEGGWVPSSPTYHADRNDEGAWVESSYGEKELDKSSSNKDAVTAFNSFIAKLNGANKIHHYSAIILKNASRDACQAHDATKFEKTFDQCVQKDRRFQSLSSEEKRKIKSLFYAIYSPEARTSSKGKEKRSEDFSKNKENLKRIAKQTASTVEFGGFKHVRLDSAKQTHMINASVLTTHNSTVNKTYTKFHSRCPVRVINSDTLDCAYGLKQQGHKVAVLNMANATRPGGGWRNGARAQEEEVFRRSNLFKALEGNRQLERQMGGKYHIKTDQAVYTPDVQVFRRGGKFQQPYEAHAPFDVNVISAAAPNLKKGAHLPGHQYNQVMQTLIENVLDTAIANGEDAVVLGAIGCGAFGHDPQRVADIFKQVLQNDYYRKNFKEISFAVINDHNSSVNHGVFKTTLNNLQ